MNSKGREEIEELGVEESAGYKNLIAIRDYVTKTREMFRGLQKENEIYKQQVRQQGIVIDQLKEQMTKLQIGLYSKKATA